MEARACASVLLSVRQPGMRLPEVYGHEVVEFWKAHPGVPHAPDHTRSPLSLTTLSVSLSFRFFFWWQEPKRKADHKVVK